jgi:hypothetical protein
MGQPITNQAGFRGRNDDGSETAATWKAVLDTNWTQLVDVKFRVRFLLTNTGNKDLADGFRLYYSHNSGAYTRVTTTSNVIQSTTSANTSWSLTDGDDTTQQLGSGTFDTGDWDNNGQTDSFTLVQAHETELEWCLTIDSATVGNGDSIELRVHFDDDTVLDNYLTGKTPNITVSEVSVVNFAATLASVTTTPDTPVLELALDLLATLASSTTTPDTVVLDKIVSFLATLASATTTPAVTLAVTRAFNAVVACGTTTPDAITINVVREMIATLAAATTTPDTVELSLAGTIQFLATLAATTTTPDAVTLAVTRDLLAVLASTTTTPDTALLGVVYELAATLASTTTTPDTVALDRTVAFLATLASTTTTPDAVLGLTLEFAAELASVTTTPDAAILSLSLELLATVATVTTTPDSAVLSVARELAAVLAAATTTPDNVVLDLGGVGEVFFSAILAAVTTTPDNAIANVARELAAVVAAATTTPDATLGFLWELSAVSAAATTTPDDAILDSFCIFLATLAATTTTPDVALDFLLGSGKPVGIMVQRPTQRVLSLGNFGAVQIYPSMPVDSVSGDWWDPNSDGLSVWAAYAAKGAASLAASYTDLSGNSHDAGVGVAPTWNGTDGWMFNGVSQYLTTTFVPANDQSQSFLVQFTNGPGTQWKGMLGMRDTSAGSTGRFLVWGQSATGKIRYTNGVTGVDVVAAPAAGNLCVAGNQGYRDGVADGSSLPAWVDTPILNIYIGALNSEGSPAFFTPMYFQALAIYDTALTAPQVSAVATAMSLL